MTEDEAKVKDEKGRKFRDGAVLHAVMHPYAAGAENISVNVDYEGTDTALCVVLAETIKLISRERHARAESVLAGTIAILTEAAHTEIDLRYMEALVNVRRAHAKAKRAQKEQEAEA